LVLAGQPLPALDLMQVLRREMAIIPYLAPSHPQVAVVVVLDIATHIFRAEMAALAAAAAKNKMQQ
jgi:hypothetical protein